MNLTLNRFANHKNFCYGALFHDGSYPIAFTVEDTYRGDAKKIKGKTCIATGTYDLGFLKVTTPLTGSYRRKYSWFKWHIHIKDVPNFSHIYIHIGNNAKDSAGCILLGQSAHMNTVDGFISSSTKMFSKFYQKVVEVDKGKFSEVFGTLKIFNTFPE